MINIVLILLGILFSAILIVGNTVVKYPAHVLFGQSEAYVLAFVSICVGAMLGIGIRGFFAAKTEELEEDF